MLTKSFNLKCMDGSGCAASFSDDSIKLFLDPKAFETLDKLKTAHEIQQVCNHNFCALTQAGLEGLVHCPFCSFAAILDDPTDCIFECISCGIHSCRYCRVKSHHPLTCNREFPRPSQD
jgi:TRIAD3 protein (E3 ubiquitin-protein ligase RNF216)